MGDRLCRRTTDRVEDLVTWVLLSAALLGIVVAALVGWGVAGLALDRSRAEAAGRTRVEAVLLTDVPVSIGEYGGPPGPAYVPARWVGPDGVERTGDVLARPDARQGTTVPIWTGRDGAAVPGPIGPFDAAVLGVTSGLGVLGSTGFVLGLLWAGARRLIDACNAAGWEREWERVGPQWTRHPR